MFLVTVWVNLIKLPHVLNIDGENRMLKVQLEIFFAWRDPRIKIGINGIANEQFLDPSFPTTDTFSLLFLPFEELCIPINASI